MMSEHGVIPAEALDPADGLGRARRGDAEAYCRLVEPLEGRLYRQAVAMCGDASLAEDLVAETLIGGWQGMEGFDGGCRLSTWLHAILLNRFQKHLRRIRVRPVSASRFTASEAEAWRVTLEGVAGEGVTGVERLLDQETSVRLRSALAALPEEHRAVVALRFFEDAPLAEIAVVLSLPLGTVKSRLHHALEKLRAMPEVVNLWGERRDS